MIGVPSGRQTAAAIISPTPCRFIGLAVDTTGGTDLTVTLYNSASTASGTVLAKLTVLNAAKNDHIIYPDGVKASSGIYAAFSGGPGGYTVIWG